MKTILSFDVGIKNLAYCIIKYDKQKLEIIKWDIINLLNNNDLQYQCEYQQCNSEIKYNILINNEIKYCLCSKHKQYSNKLKQDNYNYIKGLQINKLQNGQKCNKCLKKSLFEINNQFLCNSHYNNYFKKLNKFEIKTIKQSTKNISTDQLKLNLISNLDKLQQYILQVDEVLIENQPTFKNPQMKGLSDTIYTWFLIRGIVDKIDNSIITKVSFISPSNKLKQFNVQQQIDDKQEETEKYKITKKLGIEFCIKILNEFNLNQWLSYLNQIKKKDDLCDAFLQGWYYLNK